MSNNMYDHYIRNALNQFDKMNRAALELHILNQASLEFEQHIRIWWQNKAMQPSDPLRIFFNMGNNHDGCCQCYIVLAAQVMAAHSNKEYGKSFMLPHCKIEMSCEALMRDMDLYRFLS